MLCQLVKKITLLKIHSMQLLCLVLNETELLSDLLFELEKSGITGGTILDSTGMAKLLYNDKRDLPIFGSLYMLMNDGRPMNKTVLMVLDDEKVETAKSVIRQICDFSKPGVGIMFTLPVLSVEGSKHQTGTKN